MAKFHQIWSQCPWLRYQTDLSNLAKSKHRIDVGVVFLDLLPEPHGLVMLCRVDVLRPTSLEVVHPLAHILGPQGVHLKEINKLLLWFFMLNPEFH